MQQNSDSLRIQPFLFQDSNASQNATTETIDSGRAGLDSGIKAAPPANTSGSLATKTPKKTGQESVPQAIPQPRFHAAGELDAAGPENNYRQQEASGIDTANATSVVAPADFPPLAHLRPKNSAPWEIVILLVCLLVIAAVKAFNKRRFNMVVKSFLNSRVIPLNLREENAFSNQVIIALTSIFVLVTAATVYRLVNFWMPETGEETFRFYAQLCLFILLVYIVKFSILELLAEVLDKYQAIQEYIYTVLLFNSFLGVALLPLVLSNAVMLTFNRFFLVMGIALVGCTYLYRNWRAVKISLTYHFPVYYIFLYLCTLEILPSIVLIKLLQAQLI